jgi:MarR family transcriptional regulator, 2-MHQ and catechol-resistance regulon repressor
MPTHYQGTAQETLALNTFIKFTRAYESLTARLAQRGTIGDLTISQFGVLETLLHLGPMCQGEISGKLLKSCGNITMVLDNLEKHGLVRRERQAEDRRLVTVSLTEAGRNLISEIFPRQAAAILEEMSILSPEEQDILGELCRKLGKREKKGDTYVLAT